MVRSEEIYKQALTFRKQGFSYAEISKICGVSKGTLSSWFSKKRFSQTIAKHNAERAAKENQKRVQLLNKMRSKEREKIYKDAIKQAEVEYKHYKQSPLFMSGLMIYLTQGDRNEGTPIRLSTCDMDAQRIFTKFATEYLGVSRGNIKFWLLLSPGHTEKQCVTEWSKKLKLKPEQFYKTQVVQNASSKHMLRFGVGNTIIGSTVLKRKLMRWIELASKQL